MLDCIIINYIIINTDPVHWRIYVVLGRDGQSLQIYKQINSILSMVKFVDVTYIFKLQIENFHPCETWWKILLRIRLTLSF